MVLEGGYVHFVKSTVVLEGTLNLIRSSANIDTGMAKS
jgi:hypothetical protein